MEKKRITFSRIWKLFIYVIVGYYGVGLLLSLLFVGFFTLFDHCTPCVPAAECNCIGPAMRQSFAENPGTVLVETFVLMPIFVPFFLFIWLPYVSIFS